MPRSLLRASFLSSFLPSIVMRVKLSNGARRRSCECPIGRNLHVARPFRSWAERVRGEMEAGREGESHRTEPICGNGDIFSAGRATQLRNIMRSRNFLPLGQLSVGTLHTYSENGTDHQRFHVSSISLSLSLLRQGNSSANSRAFEIETRERESERD